MTDLPVVNLEARLKELVVHEIRLAGATPAGDLDDATVLAASGLDSLGFASITVAMDQELGLDPFGGTEDIIYPETFGELVSLYEKAHRNKQGETE